jgi:hypothetical protein
MRVLTTPMTPELIQPYGIESSALTPFLGELQRTNSPDSILPRINSLLPNSRFLEEPCAKGLAIKRFERLGSIELFNLMAFLISNNFPGESNSQNIYKWLKKHNPPFVLKILSSIETPSTEALLEKLFRSQLRLKMCQLSST